MMVRVRRPRKSILRRPSSSNVVMGNWVVSTPSLLCRGTTVSKGTPEIPQEVYQKMYDQWQADLVSDSGYTHAAMTQGAACEDEGSHL